MSTASDLHITPTTDAGAMAAEIFGAGVTVVSASYSGDPLSAALYTGAEETLGGISPTDSGLILSTGHAADFTNASGGTNTDEGTTTDTDGLDDDPGMNSVALQSTCDAAILEAVFIPDAEVITMQFVFSSEEYLEYVDGKVNDSIGVWVNGQEAALIIDSTPVSVDTLNAGDNPNLYVDNPVGADLYNTEMDGFTVTLTLTAPVVPGVENTIKIGIADGGDAKYDSNLLIMGNSVQTQVIANADDVSLEAGTAKTVDLMANDTNLSGTTMTITHLNGKAVQPGDTIALPSGEKLTLNADGTVTVQGLAETGENSFTYSVQDGTGTGDTGFVTIRTEDDLPGDGIVEGGAGDDVIDAGYAGDPEGDRIDAGDALLPGESGDDDIVTAGAGNDTVIAGAGDDELSGGDGDDRLDGGAGDDRLQGGAGTDTLLGGDDRDTFEAGSGDVVDGGEGGDDYDTLVVNDVLTIGFDPDNAENGSITFIDNSSMVFTNIENVVIASGRDGIVDGTDGFDAIGIGYVDADGDAVDADDAFLPGQSGDDDIIEAGAGADIVLAGDGNDLVMGGSGNDLLEGGPGLDTLLGGDDADTLRGGAGDLLDGGEGGDDRDMLDLSGQGPLIVTFDAGNAENGRVDFLDAEGEVTGTLTFANIENVVPCFTPGCLIATDLGLVAAEDLAEGHRVLTRDNGFQPVRWVGSRSLTPTELEADPRLNPVLIRAGALGHGLPERDMIVSPQHRMLVTGAKAEMLVGEHEVLVAATHLVGLRGVQALRPQGVTYIHMMFDQHEILRSDGAWSESFQPGDRTLSGLGDAPRSEILRLFPHLALPGGMAYPAARITLKRHEAALLLR